MSMMKNPYALGFSGGHISLCGSRIRNLRVDAYTPRHLSRIATFIAAYAIRLLCPSRRWQIHGVMDTRPAELGGGLDLIQPGDSDLLRWQHHWRNRNAVYLLPFSGLFMSVIYPTVNSKGISCFRKTEHGAVAGVILFFTCGAAV